MTREEIKAIIEGITDEQLKQILDINGADINKAKGSKADLEKQNETLQTELTEAKETIAKLETAGADVEKLQKEINDYKALEEKRKQEAEQATLEQRLTERFNASAGEAKFINDFTRAGLLNEFKAALQDKANEGKSDSDIYSAITKDRDGIFVNPNAPKDIPGVGIVKTPGNSDEMTDDEFYSVYYNKSK